MYLEALGVVVRLVVGGTELGVPGGAVPGAEAVEGCGVDGGTGTAAMSDNFSGRLRVPVVVRRLRSMTVA